MPHLDITPMRLLSTRLFDASLASPDAYLLPGLLQRCEVERAYVSLNTAHHSHGATDFMTSEGKGVDTEAIDIKWDVKKTLNSICMKIGPMLMSAGCKVGDRLNCSRFVVGEHYRNEGNRIVHHAGEGFRLDNSMAVGQNQVGGKAAA